jgi:hypothetical protein
MSTKEAAAFLDVSPHTVKKWCEMSLGGDKSRVRHVRIENTGYMLLSRREVSNMPSRFAEQRRRLDEKRRALKKQQSASKNDVGYSLRIGEFKEMMIAQKSRCAICGAKKDYDLCVDHCHKTGKIRGLLCRPCNVGLGQFKDNKKLLACAIRYLSQ